MPMFNTHDLSYGIMPANSFINLMVKGVFFFYSIQNKAVSEKLATLFFFAN